MLKENKKEDEKLAINDALNLAVKYHKEGRLKQAEILYRKILVEDSNNADAMHLLGVIVHQLGKHEEAIAYISKAIKLNPNNAIYYNNLAMVYDSLNREEESTKNFKRALEIDSNHTNAHLAYYNLGVCYADKGDITSALEYYDKAIELNRNFYDARWNRGLLLLTSGRFEEGWREYECRFKKKSPTDSRVFDKPQWDGSSLKGRRILILSEQGLGDSIQFMRYIPLVKDKVGYVIYECKKELRRLFDDFPGIDEIVEKEKNTIPNVKFDTYTYLMSLPGIFNTSLDNIPNKIPYLKANPGLAKNFKLEFNNDNFKVGIVWAGNPEQDNDKNRSTTFEKFKALKNIQGIQLYSLQKGEAEKQLDDSAIINMADKINDFADTAAIIENLDLVISVDTSVAHLAGAMGKPVWTLLTFMPDWRWLLDRNDSPWYPNMKLFRQQKLGDWDSMFDEVSEELANLVK